MITLSLFPSPTRRPLVLPEIEINNGYPDPVAAALRGRPHKSGHPHRGAPTSADRKGAIYSICIYYIYRPEGRGRNWAEGM
jgi:hypothetical protein